jgi:DNA polymerase-4
VRDRVGLPITVGIARTKFLAKVASQEAKPDGLLLVPPDRELAFLHPLPVRRLWGVGAKTAEKLHGFGIDTVADVAELSESTLCSLVGHAMGSRLFALSRNIDRRRVVTEVRRRSIGAQRALGRRGNTMSEAEIDAVVVNLIDRITRRMRAAGRTGRTVVLRLRFDDFSRATRSHTMPRATASTDAILAAARGLVAAAAPLIAEKGLTLIGFAVSNIDRDGAQQLELPFDDQPDTTTVDAAVDQVRRRYGNTALTRGVLVGRDPGLEIPHLPD